MDMFMFKRLQENISELLMVPLEFQGIHLTLINVYDCYYDFPYYVPPHRHQWFEINYFLDGSMISYFDSNKFVNFENEAFLVPAGQTHSHESTLEHLSTQLCFRFRLEEGNTDLSKSFYNVLTRNDLNHLDLKFDMLCKKIDTKNTFLKICGFWEWLFAVFESELTAKGSMTEGKKKNTIIWQALKIIEDNYKTKLTVEDIAKMLSISYRSLARHFKENNINVKAQITDARMREAQHLLITTDLPIKNIALSIGYDNEFYFSNVFKKFNDVSPSEYREKKQNKQ